jgi:peptidoglycan/xylan/chitin deacetylase (PgdA/CDA1 family)
MRATDRLSDVFRLGQLYYGGLRALGVPAANRRLQDAGVILGYHNVVPAGDMREGDGGLHVAHDRFEQQMRWLVAHYTVVPLGEFVSRAASGASLRSVAAVTFDDGYAGVFEVGIPILTAMGVPATVFLVSDAVGRSRGFWWDHPEIVESISPGRREEWLTAMRGDGEAILSGRAKEEARRPPPAYRPAEWGLIRARLGPGIELGGHSATHRSLPTLADDELEYEVVASRATIHGATGIRPDLFAYPYGRWDSRVRERVKAAGYRAALTLDAGLVRRQADPWSLRRVNVPALISDAAFEAWAAGLGASRSA